jgi:hypothetical protein
MQNDDANENEGNDADENSRFQDAEDPRINNDAVVDVGVDVDE